MWRVMVWYGGGQLAFSFSKYIDWAAHFGGAIQGAIAGIMMLTVELDNVYSKVGRCVMGDGR